MRESIQQSKEVMMGHEMYLEWFIDFANNPSE